MNNKKKYEKAEIEIILIKKNDIITGSKNDENDF